MDTDMEAMAMDTGLDMVLAMDMVMATTARGLLMLRPAMDMAMDTDMEAMAMDTVLDMVLAMDMAMDMAMEVMDMDTAMDMAMDMAMAMAMDTAMDTDTMDKRRSQKKFHTENNTKSS